MADYARADIVKWFDIAENLFCKILHEAISVASEADAVKIPNLDRESLIQCTIVSAI
jgi:hypothetical protein